MDKIFLLFTLCFIACNSEKKIGATLKSWLGHSKNTSIQTWGYPKITESDNAGGEILIYADYLYYQIGEPTTVFEYGVYRMLYANSTGKIYRFERYESATPPKTVDVKRLIQ